MAYENRKYVIFNVSELSSVDFSEVMETSADTVRKSLDESLTFVKYEGMTTVDENDNVISVLPTSVAALTTKSQEYTHSEILTILAGADWTDPNPTESV